MGLGLLYVCCNGVAQCFGRRAWPIITHSFLKLARDALAYSSRPQTDLKGDVHVNRA